MVNYLSVLVTYIKHLIARFLLYLMGWEFHTKYALKLPEDLDKFPKKWMVFGEPHTHNFDFLLMQLFFWYYKLPAVRFLINNKFNKGIIGMWMKWMGAIFINTKERQGAVQQVRDAIPSCPLTNSAIGSWWDQQKWKNNCSYSSFWN